MLQTQKLNTIIDLLEQNKERELSYTKSVNLVVEDKITNKNYAIIKEKYVWFETLEGAIIFNQIDWSLANLYYFIFKVNFYKPSLTNDSRMWGLINWQKLITKFKIENSKKFINSLLDFIDLEKSTQNVYSDTEQKKELLTFINKSKNGFNNSSFPLVFQVKNYINSHTQYYKILKTLEDYTIENIQIFNNNIIFTLRENSNKKTNIIYSKNDLYINNEKVYFKTKDTIIFELVKLIFSYFQENNTNNVKLYELEEYYKQHEKDYKELKKARFDYEYLRKSIDTKSRKIEEKHQVKKPFLGINTSTIICQELDTESK